LRKQNRDENVGGDNADKSSRNPFDGIDEAIHRRAIHVSLPRGRDCRKNKAAG